MDDFPEIAPLTTPMWAPHATEARIAARALPEEWLDHFIRELRPSFENSDNEVAAALWDALITERQRRG